MEDARCTVEAQPLGKVLFFGSMSQGNCSWVLGVFVRGLVYVKRDMSNEEAPRTFTKEEGNVLHEWTKWAHVALHLPAQENLPPKPSAIPKSVSLKARSSARSAVLASLNNCGPLPIARHMEIVAALGPAVGWPWEGMDGSVYPSPKNSWLRAGFDQSTQPHSGWIEWASASLRILSSRQIAENFLSQKTIIDPWDSNEWADWSYLALESWWQSSQSSLSAKPQIAKASLFAFRRWTAFIHEIDQRMHVNPSPLGLPLHWQVAARQAERCLLVKPDQLLMDMGPLPPIHSEIEIAGKPLRAWMGVAEWAMARFSRTVQETHRWPEEQWNSVRAVMEEDIHSRGEKTMSLMTPFHSGLMRAIARIQKSQKNSRDIPDDAKIQQCRVEVDAWLLSVGTPKVVSHAPVKSRRL